MVVSLFLRNVTCVSLGRFHCQTPSRCPGVKWGEDADRLKFLYAGGLCILAVTAWENYCPPENKWPKSTQALFTRGKESNWFAAWRSSVRTRSWGSILRVSVKNGFFLVQTAPVCQNKNNLDIPAARGLTKCSLVKWNKSTKACRAGLAILRSTHKFKNKRLTPVL